MWQSDCRKLIQLWRRNLWPKSFPRCFDLLWETSKRGSELSVLNTSSFPSLVSRTRCYNVWKSVEDGHTRPKYSVNNGELRLLWPQMSEIEEFEGDGDTPFRHAKERELVPEKRFFSDLGGATMDEAPFLVDTSYRRSFVLSIIGKRALESLHEAMNTTSFELKGFLKIYTKLYGMQRVFRM